MRNNLFTHALDVVDVQVVHIVETAYLVVQAGLRLVILTQLPKCWDYVNVPACPTLRIILLNIAKYFTSHPNSMK